MSGSWRKILYGAASDGNVAGNVKPIDLSTGGGTGQYLGISGDTLVWSNPQTASGDTTFTKLGLTDDGGNSITVKCVGAKIFVSNIATEYSSNTPSLGTNNWSTWTGSSSTNIDESDWAGDSEYLEFKYDAVFAKFDGSNIVAHGLSTGTPIFHSTFSASRFNGLFSVERINDYFYSIRKQTNPNLAVDNRYPESDENDSANIQIADFIDEGNPDVDNLIIDASSIDSPLAGVAYTDIIFMTDYSTFSLKGTANQLTTSVGTSSVFGGGEITLSTPQDIHTDADVVFNSFHLKNDSKIVSNKKIFLDGNANTSTSPYILSPTNTTDICLHTPGVDSNGNPSKVHVKHNLKIDGNLEVDGTTTTIDVTTLNVSDKNIELGGQGKVPSGILSITGGSGQNYVTANGVSTTGGTGTGLTVNITTSGGQVTTVTVNNQGSGYTTGDVVTITQNGPGDPDIDDNCTVTIGNTQGTDSAIHDGGLILKGSSDKSLLWNNTDARFDINQSLNIDGANNKFLFNGVEIIQNSSIGGTNLVEIGDGSDLLGLVAATLFMTGNTMLEGNLQLNTNDLAYDKKIILSRTKNGSTYESWKDSTIKQDSANVIKLDTGLDGSGGSATGTVTVSNDLNISNDLDVTNDVTIGNDLTVAEDFVTKTLALSTSNSQIGFQAKNSILSSDGSWSAITYGRLDIYGRQSSTHQNPEIRLYESAVGATHYTTISMQSSSANLNFKLPATAGSNGDVLRTDGAGVLSWVAQTGGMSNLIDDTSPELGGDLNVSSHGLIDTNSNEILEFSAISSAVNNISISNAMTGKGPLIEAKGDDTNIPLNLEAQGSGDINFTTNTNRKIKFDFDGATATKTLTFESNHTDNRTLTLPDATATLATTDDINSTNLANAGALMDTEVTNLAQVKAFDSSDYATASQGALADSAQQPPSEGAFVNGDKTKLDGLTITLHQSIAGSIRKSESDTNFFLLSDGDREAWDTNTTTLGSSSFGAAGHGYSVFTATENCTLDKFHFAIYIAKFHDTEEWELELWKAENVSDGNNAPTISQIGSTYDFNSGNDLNSNVVYSVNGQGLNTSLSIGDRIYFALRQKTTAGGGSSSLFSYYNAALKLTI